MKTIFLILLFLVLGVLSGFLMAKLLIFVSTWLLERKATKEALNEKERTFSFMLKPYDLKESIEYEQKQRKKGGFFGIFKKKQMKGGISDYGNTIQPRNNERTRDEQVPTTRGNVESTTPSPASPSPTTPKDRGEQGNPTTPPRGERRISSRNLFEKGEKFY